MDVYLHTIIAFLPILAAYWAGRYWLQETLVEDVVGQLISKLDNEGFIRTEEDKNGEIELVPISEIVAKTLRDAYKRV